MIASQPDWMRHGPPRVRCKAAGTVGSMPIADPVDRRTPLLDLRRTLSWYQHGRGDPTTRVTASSMASVLDPRRSGHRHA